MEEMQVNEIGVSLTSFTDYLLKAGRPKINAVRRIREQYEQGYNRGFDYYRLFRERVVSVLANQGQMGLIESIVDEVCPESKSKNYAVLTRGFQRFWARTFQEHEWVWAGSKSRPWSFGGLSVRVNPEIGITLDGQIYLIKLYNKADSLKKNQLDVILHLMQVSLMEPGARVVPAVLDVRRGRLFEATSFVPEMTALLEGEALNFVHLWRAVVSRDPEEITA